MMSKVTRRKQMQIPVVFCADKNFMIPLQVALESLMCNKKMNTDYDIYVLHSDDLDVSKIELNVIDNKTKLHFIAMGDMYQLAYISNPVWTAATFYRLCLHRVLPNTYMKCIYCDCDVIINCDLWNLFNENIDDYYLAGIKDPVISYSDYRSIFPNLDKYINAGVLLINLDKWRKTHIENLFEKYIKQNLRYQDQDILNLACKNKILLLENNKYVMMSFLNRRKYSIPSNTIIHYCGLVKPWDIALRNSFFELWIYYAKKASVNINKAIKERRKRIDDYLSENNIKKVIVWGMSAATLDFCFFLEELSLEIIAIGDNNKQKVIQGAPYFKMISITDVFKYRENICFIILSNRHYCEIKDQLMAEGILPNRIICWNDLRNVMYDVS